MYILNYNGQTHLVWFCLKAIVTSVRKSADLAAKNLPNCKFCNTNIISVNTCIHQPTYFHQHPYSYGLGIIRQIVRGVYKIVENR